MIDRARDIIKMMGYKDVEATLAAIGRGDIILLKMEDSDLQLHVAKWLRAQQKAMEAGDPALAEALNDIADSLDLALELMRYPADTDICEMDLPHGWPSYCERDRLK